MTEPISHRWFVLATVAHAGFQVVVTRSLYPALAAVAPADWPEAHALHSRRIVPVVGLVYGGVLVSGAAALARTRRGWLVGALAAEAGAVLTTALAAAPLHRRLGRRRTDRALRALLAADRVRTAGAVLGALVAVAGSVVDARRGGGARPDLSRTWGTGANPRGCPPTPAAARRRCGP